MHSKLASAAAAKVLGSKGGKPDVLIGHVFLKAQKTV